MTPDEIADMRSMLDAYPDSDTIGRLLDEIERLRTENAALINDSAAWLLGYDAARVYFTAEAAAALDEAVQSAAVPVGWQLVRIPEVDDILEEDDPQCSCTHPHHHTGRCANEADNGGLCLPCIHGCTT